MLTQRQIVCVIPDMPFAESDSTDAASVPIAYATPTDRYPIDNDALLRKVTGYVGRTQGQMYLGPRWVTDDGAACVVLIASDDKAIKRVRDHGRFGLIAWRWNNTPSAPLSLTLVTKKENPRPHVRWMCASDDPVVQAIRREGRFLVAVATSKGRHTGWYEASFRTPPGDQSSFDALQSQWQFPTPGITHSNIHARFDPLRREPFNDEGADEIPLWPEPQSDYWSTLHYDGPWSEDLRARDHAMAAWGRQAYVWRSRAAGIVQMIIERQALGESAALVDAAGQWTGTDALREHVTILIQRAPSLGAWLLAVAGPKPSAKAAYDAAFATLHSPYDLFCLFDKLFELLGELDDWVLTESFRANLEAVLLDWRVTHCGTYRPWLANTGTYGLEIKAMQFNLDRPLEDIERVWVSGLESMDLFDLGLRIGADDFPAPFDAICDAFDSLVLEGPIEDAEATVQTMLVEAQDARQWSIPWGARVEVNFGPFVAVKIFEMGGEFACHFVDEQERYLHVAIGLKARPPRVASPHLVRVRHDDGEPVWNDDAEVSLKLIAAAIVRDFIVVEERESLFSARQMRRRVRGRDLRTLIYLPRVRYTAPHPGRHAGAEADGLRRARHPVGPHLRRAGQASAAQRFLAQRYGMHLPEGFTFVRPHERGGAAEQERVKVYRSRSASRMIFDEIASAPEGTRPAWFDFEKDCARLLASRGMRVIHQAARRDGDGGVDLFAVDEHDASWVVQCKCWAVHRPVGPGVVRELVGAIAAADRGSEKDSRGMIITTSRFTPGAVSEALQLGFELIDGEALR